MCIGDMLSRDLLRVSAIMCHNLSGSDKPAEVICKMSETVSSDHRLMHAGAVSDRRNVMMMQQPAQAIASSTLGPFVN